MTLHSQRQYTEEGPQSLQFSEIAAFLSLEGQGFPKSYIPKLTRLLRGLDYEYSVLYAKRVNKS